MADVTGLTYDELSDLVDQLSAERDQLAHALESRIVIEQAKGVLAERYTVTVEDAFLLLRRSARSARVRIHDLAADVVGSSQTPQAVIRGMARDSKLRAAALRERNEAVAERIEEIRSSSAELTDRLNRSTSRATARVRVTNRSDAVDLAACLGGYRWYLIVPDEQHWDVVVELNGPATDLPSDLRERLHDWLSARSIPSIQVRLGELELEIFPS